MTDLQQLQTKLDSLREELKQETTKLASSILEPRPEIEVKRIREAVQQLMQAYPAICVALSQLKGLK